MKPRVIQFSTLKSKVSKIQVLMERGLGGLGGLSGSTVLWIRLIRPIRFLSGLALQVIQLHRRKLHDPEASVTPLCEAFL